LEWQTADVEILLIKEHPAINFIGYLKTHFNINGYQGTLPKIFGGCKVISDLTAK